MQPHSHALNHCKFAQSRPNGFKTMKTKQTKRQSITNSEKGMIHTNSTLQNKSIWGISVNYKSWGNHA